MKLVKLFVSLACCLLFSTPLWAASLTPIDEATPNPSGLYALSTIAASGAVTELTDKELARIEGGELAAVMEFTLEATISCPTCGFYTVIACFTHGQGTAPEKPLPSTAGIKSNAAALSNTRAVVSVIFGNI